MVSLAVCVLSASGTYAADANGERLQRFFTEVKSLRADFEQTVTDAKGKVIQEAKGTFALQRPGKFRWDYRAPYQQVIVADGRKIWVYDTDLEQVTVKPLDSALGGTPAQLLSGIRPLEQDFVITGLGPRDGLEWVELVSKAKEKEFERVRLGFDQRDLRMMEIADSFGQSTRLKFSNLQRNPAIDAKTFVFVPPKGVDVVSD
ncbi:MAG: outer membrane lipoprotein chaperone LolA [Gammaproteobacteria bacterium]